MWRKSALMASRSKYSVPVPEDNTARHPWNRHRKRSRRSGPSAASSAIPWIPVSERPTYRDNAIDEICHATLQKMEQQHPASPRLVFRACVHHGEVLDNKYYMGIRLCRAGHSSFDLQAIKELAVILDELAVAFRCFVEPCIAGRHSWLLGGRDVWPKAAKTRFRATANPSNAHPNPRCPHTTSVSSFSSLMRRAHPHLPPIAFMRTDRSGRRQFGSDGRRSLPRDNICYLHIDRRQHSQHRRPTTGQNVPTAADVSSYSPASPP